MVEVLEMPLGYDRKKVNYEQVMALTFGEGAGVATYDRAKPHRPEVTLVNTPTWAQIIPSNKTVLQFNGVNEYFQCLAADTPDLDFTDDYSMVGWVNWTDTGFSEIVIARYELDATGWEIYLTVQPGPIYYLTQRHHHASLGAGNLRDGCYSVGWTLSEWHLMGISRSGLYPVHYRNGVPLTMTYSADGMRDPDACARDLVNCRFTKDANWYQNQVVDLRLWDAELSTEDHAEIFATERHLFGV